MAKLSRIIVLVLVLSGIRERIYAGVSSSLTPERSYRIIAQRFARSLETHHLSRHPLDDAISARAWTNFLVSLDTERLFFLQSDVENFSSMKYQLDDDIKGGNIDFPYVVFNQFRTRVKEAINYITHLLEHNIELKKGETYRWRRDQADWPVDENEDRSSGARRF